MKRAVIAATLFALAQSAWADAPKVLVLQSEGRSDKATRAKVDAAIIKLASSGDAQVSPGDITFTDAAAAVGCKPSVATCRDEVLEMLAVDEVVYATITTKPGGTEVHVHRVSNGGTTRDAKMLIAPGEPADKLDGIAPLFVTAKPDKPIEPPVEPTSPRSNDTILEPLDPAQPPESTEPKITAPLDGPRDYVWSPRRKRFELAGMIGGGASVFVGFLLWAKAGSIQDQVDNSPVRTKAQLDELATLEARGDAYAGWGNLLFLSGSVVGGISTYFYFRDRRRARASASARIMPAVFDHGAGIAFSYGVQP